MERRRFIAQSSMLMIAAASRLSAESKNWGALTELSASAAANAMRAGEIKAEDYAAALLAQAERWKHLNAFRTLQPESVMEAARAADKQRASGARLGALHGVLLPVKDSVNTRALPTSNGTKALRDFRPAQDAEVLKPLFEAGAILMGKTNLHEISGGWSSNNHAFGAVLNPYDVRRTPGGSSGGSGAAVAARMAPIAIAEDTYGSIRVPAAFCGLAGLRCTYGRYPAGGLMPLARNKFDQVGALARGVEDLVLFDSVVTGAKDRVVARPLEGVRIAISPQFLFDGIDPETGRIIDAAIARLKEAGATIVTAELPQTVRSASAVVRSLIAYELAPALTEFLEQERTGLTLDQFYAQLSPNLAGMMAGSRNPGPPERYQALLTQMQEIRAAFATWFSEQRVEALAFAPSMIPAFPQGDVQQVEVNGRKVSLLEVIGRNVGLGSCASLACLVVPAGQTAAGLPVGLELDGPSGSDRRLLALGLSVERALGPIKPPNLTPV